MKMEPMIAFKPEANAALRLLSQALRTPKNDPVGFRWNYRNYENCTMGLAERLGLLSSIQLSMPEKEFDRIFVWGGSSRTGSLAALKLLLFGRRRCKVADDIDAYLDQTEELVSCLSATCPTSNAFRFRSGRPSGKLIGQRA